MEIPKPQLNAIRFIWFMFLISVSINFSIALSTVYDKKIRGLYSTAKN
jgi:hypothetical protein